MLRKRLITVLSLIVVLVMVLTACGPSAPPGQLPPRQAGKGGWLDEINVSVVAGESAISQIQAGAINVFSFGLASSDLPAIKDSGLSYSRSYGGYYGIMFNPAPFKDTGVLNPFADRKIREAVNWLIDRNYVNQEIYGGGSLPKFFGLTTNLVDYTGVIDVARALETKYAYNLDKAKQVISDEMKSLGATEGAGGKWQFNDKPVSLIFLIRPDGDGTRKPMGDYVATQLENVGFTVDRQYKTSSEASPIWIGSDPVDGLWHIYTAGWLPSGLTRDEGNIFQQMYLSSSVQGMNVFLANTDVDPAFQKVGDDLAQGNYNTLQERHDLIAKAMELSLQDSLQVWVIDQQQFSPFQNDVTVTYDLASGIEAAPMTSYNLRFSGKEGGQMKVGTNDLFTEPWNPVAGSNWVWDSAVMRATSSYGLMPDPYTGLAWPMRIEKAEVTAQTGLPISKSLDWVSLKTADKITVPDDALVDWDAKAQKFITAKEKFPSGETAKVMSVVTYPGDLFNKIKWHDGSSMSVADFVMPMIMTFDRANPDSKIYDEASVPNFESFAASFKGFRITSTNPLTIEYYSDLYTSDAELNVATLWPQASWGLLGEENSWHMLAISNLAEASGELAYTPDKADANKIEQTSWIGGPSMDILSKHIDESISTSYIPYATALGQYISADQAKERYNNLKAWYKVHSHYWIGTGPYYIDKAFLTEKTITLKNNGLFPDASNRWSDFSTPKLATIELVGPDKVKIGSEATFDVTLTFKGDPYPQADVKQVKYLVYDATGAVVTTGEAKFVSDGKYQVVLGADITSKLAAGSVKLEVAAVPIPVAIPAFISVEFVVEP